jgi:type IV/VI secretion system ImpK/VasF family protein
VSAPSLDPLLLPLFEIATAIADDPASRLHPQQLRQTIDHLIATAHARTAELSISEPDFRAALFAVVAFLDEHLANYYHPTELPPAALTLHYFEDNNAGVGFFTRLEQLVVEQRWNVVRIYYLALGLGFAGQYAFSSDRSALVAHRRRLATLMGLGIATVPLDDAPSRLGKQRPAWYAWAPLGIAGVSLVALAVVIAIH